MYMKKFNNIPSIIQFYTLYFTVCVEGFAYVGINCFCILVYHLPVYFHVEVDLFFNREPEETEEQEEEEAAPVADYALPSSDYGAPKLWMVVDC